MGFAIVNFCESAPLSVHATVYTVIKPDWICADTDKESIVCICDVFGITIKEKINLRVENDTQEHTYHNAPFKVNETTFHTFIYQSPECMMHVNRDL